MARLRDKAISRGGEILIFNPEDIMEITGYNVRDMESEESREYINSLVDSIRENGTATFPPIRVGQIGGEVFVYDGHCRLRAFKQALQEGLPIKGIPAIVAPYANQEEATLGLLTSNEGKQLNPVEKAEAYRRLRDFGWSPSEIARKRAVTINTIINYLLLADAPTAIRDKVRRGEISFTLAIETLRTEKEMAEKVLTSAVEDAQQEGKTKATSKNIKGGKSRINEEQVYAAEQQLSGFISAMRGETLTALVKTMGLTPAEWDYMQQEYSMGYLTPEEREEIDLTVNPEEEE